MSFLKIAAREWLPPILARKFRLAHFVEAGRTYIQDEYLGFYNTIGQCLSENRPNVIVLSSVLQYLESPLELIGELSRTGALCLIVDRTPFMLQEKTKLVIQKVPASIYLASYPMWIFSLPEFRRQLEDGWSLVATTISPEGNVRTTGGFEFSFQGMLLESHR